MSDRLDLVYLLWFCLFELLSDRRRDDKFTWLWKTCIFDSMIWFLAGYCDIFYLLSRWEITRNFCIHKHELATFLCTVTPESGSPWFGDVPPSVFAHGMHITLQLSMHVLKWNVTWPAFLSFFSSFPSLSSSHFYVCLSDWNYFELISPVAPEESR